ncbi:hypothetical protein EV401DRAFT_1377900 [Pisolithus croceorrhizus]|nr:hypothetical protein EV401DRAFT_1377900 [Pisolithus croceorrhizus]
MVEAYKTVPILVRNEPRGEWGPNNDSELSPRWGTTSVGSTDGGVDALAGSTIKNISVTICRQTRLILTMPLPCGRRLRMPRRGHTWLSLRWWGLPLLPNPYGRSWISRASTLLNGIGGFFGYWRGVKRRLRLRRRKRFEEFQDKARHVSSAHEEHRAES